MKLKTDPRKLEIWRNYYYRNHSRLKRRARLNHIKNRNKVLPKMRAHYHRNQKERRAYTRRYYRTHREEIAHLKRTKYRLHSRKSMLKCTYGLTLGEYDSMLISQNRVCAICKKPERKKNRWGGYSKFLMVDHRKRPFKVRGLLCNRCNTGIGLFREDRIFLLAAARYLKKHS